MNILHILGNGFDKNLGLKTGYEDFYKYYKEVDNIDPIIKKLKEDIDWDIDNWSDLEIALGKYSKELNKGDFEKVYTDLVNNLCDHLDKQIELFQESNYDNSKMFSYLAFSADYLEYKDKKELQEFITNKKEEVIVDVITLNYTKTLEKILIKFNTPRYYHYSRDGVSYVLGIIKHIHGYTDNRLILGVNDSEQILNEEFRTDLEIDDMFIKHKANSSQRHGVDAECYSIIEKADLFYIYGSSLGETDKYIWELLGKRLEEGAKLVIFDRGSGLNSRFGHQLMRARSIIKDRFIELAGIDDKYRENIYVGLKTNIFKFD
jgi:hypothetical protein